MFTFVIVETSIRRTIVNIYCTMNPTRGTAFFNSKKTNPRSGKNRINPYAIFYPTFSLSNQETTSLLHWGCKMQTSLCDTRHRFMQFSYIVKPRLHSITHSLDFDIKNLRFLPIKFISIQRNCVSPLIRIADWRDSFIVNRPVVKGTRIKLRPFMTLVRDDANIQIVSLNGVHY